MAIKQKLEGVTTLYREKLARQLERAQTIASPAVESVNLQVRTGMSVPFSPYMLGTHAEELLKKRVMISPVVVAWRYKIATPGGLH